MVTVPDECLRDGAAAVLKSLFCVRIEEEPVGTPGVIERSGVSMDQEAVAVVVGDDVTDIAKGFYLPEIEIPFVQGAWPAFGEKVIVEVFPEHCKHFSDVIFRARDGYVEMIAHPLEGEDAYGGKAECADCQKGHGRAVVLFRDKDNGMIFWRVEVPAWAELAEDEFTAGFFGGKGVIHSHLFCPR